MSFGVQSLLWNKNTWYKFQIFWVVFNSLLCLQVAFCILKRQRAQQLDSNVRLFISALSGSKLSYLCLWGQKQWLQSLGSLLQCEESTWCSSQETDLCVLWKTVQKCHAFVTLSLNSGQINVWTFGNYSKLLLQIKPKLYLLKCIIQIILKFI